MTKDEIETFVAELVSGYSMEPGDAAALHEVGKRALRAAPQTPAPQADLVALVAKWREEAAAYPVASSTGAMWTSVAVNACANELAAALAPPVGEPAAMPPEMPEVRPGDWVRLSGFGWTPVSKQREAELLTGNDGVEEIQRPTVIWRRTDRKEQTK